MISKFPTAYNKATFVELNDRFKRKNKQIVSGMCIKYFKQELTFFFLYIFF